MSAVIAMAVAKTDEDYLDEARAICRRVKTVWFTAEYRVDPATRALVRHYNIFRRGMGYQAGRSSPAALVSYLRKQLPAEAKA